MFTITVFIIVTIILNFSIILPIKLADDEIEIQKNKLRVAAMENGIGNPGNKILKAVEMASRQTDLSQEFLLSLIYSESSFKKNALSKKNYKGLLQIPQNVPYEDANILIGARIFLEKLAITKGDYRKAIILYKGWPLNHPKGKKEADKVIKLTVNIKEKL